MGVSLATCPVCRCVVDGQEQHAQAWHEPIARLLEFTAVAPQEAPSAADGQLWGGPPVPAPPRAPSPAESARAAVLRARAGEAYTATQTLTGQLENYLSGTSTRPPTILEINAQVRLLTVATRDLLAAARDLIRLSTRALQEP